MVCSRTAPEFEGNASFAKARCSWKAISRDNGLFALLGAKQTMDTNLESAVWSTAYVNNLPDSSFAVVESGDKDSSGKTTPRSLRHLPYKDASGKVDLAHLRNALARLNQTSISQELKDKARRKLENAAREAGVGDYGKAAASMILETLNELRAAGSVNSDHMRTLRDCHAMLGELIDSYDKMQSARIYFDGSTISFGGVN